MLRLLADHELVAVDERGLLVSVYPFSPTPTAHVVKLSAGVGDVRIDALAMPSMLDLDVTITSRARSRCGESA